MDKIEICSINGCDKPIINGRGWCSAHYKRWQRHGDPLAGRTSNGEPLAWLRRHVDHKDQDNCLFWPFAVTTGRASVRFRGKTQFAHRVMCRLVHGEPAFIAAQAAHSCGAGHLGCINPHHLRWATQTENEADKLLHGTSNRGEQHGMSKLTDTEARQILSMKGSHTQRQIAALFGIDQSTVSNIWTGKRWGWL